QLVAVGDAAAEVGGVVGEGAVGQRQRAQVLDAAAGVGDGGDASAAPEGGGAVGDGQAGQVGGHAGVDREGGDGPAAVDGNRAGPLVVGDAQVGADRQPRGEADAPHGGAEVDDVAGLGVVDGVAQRLRVGGRIAAVRDGQQRRGQPVLQRLQGRPA